jgi:hypothetical protein
MKVRTSTKTVTFARPFVLGDLGETLPAGAYSVETHEELVPDISFIAYRRVSVEIHLPSPCGNPVLARSVLIHPRELDAAMLRDAAPAGGPPTLGSRSAATE